MAKINVAIIPARGGSKGIPGKNIKGIACAPLIAWTISESRKCKYIDRLFVSTDDEKIARISEDYGAEVLMRPEKLASDDIHAVHAIIYHTKQLKKELKPCSIKIGTMAMILATSPCRTVEDLNGAYKTFFDNCCDSVISVVERDGPLSGLRKIIGASSAPVTPTDFFEVQRQMVKDHLVDVNGSIYISTPEHLKKCKSFHVGEISPYVMKKSHSVDINDLDDFFMAESILINRTNYK